MNSMIEYPQAESKILGVCAWISNKFEFDVSYVRIAFVVAAVLGIGSPVIIYIVAAIILKIVE